MVYFLLSELPSYNFACILQKIQSGRPLNSFNTVGPPPHPPPQNIPHSPLYIPVHVWNSLLSCLIQALALLRWRWCGSVCIYQTWRDASSKLSGGLMQTFRACATVKFHVPSTASPLSYNESVSMLYFPINKSFSPSRIANISKTNYYIRKTIVRPWRCKQESPPKRWYIHTHLHGIILQPFHDLPLTFF